MGIVLDVARAARLVELLAAAYREERKSLARDRHADVESHPGSHGAMIRRSRAAAVADSTMK
jgi:hypothetical protein